MYGYHVLKKNTKEQNGGVEEDGPKELKASRSSKDETTLGSVTYTDDNGA